MRKVLYGKFAALYAILGVIGFFLTFTLGSRLVENQLQENIGRKLYSESTAIASGDNVKYNITSSNLDSLSQNLKALSTYQDAQIWVMNTDSEILLNTAKYSKEPESLTDFDPTAWGSSYYQIGNFYGYFNENMMSVIAPITSNMNIRGYVVMHYPMRALYEERDRIRSSLILIFVLIYVLFSSLVVFFAFYVYRPLQKITKGANEFAQGNLTYHIPVKTDDEMGYLAATLNYMSDELDKNGQYQRNFIANVSHDFRSPLTSIKGYVEAIADGTIPVELQGKYLEIVSREAERLEKLTRSLLTLNDLDVKTRMMNIRAFDINKIIKNTAASFEGTCRKRQILLELILSGESLYALADMEQIQQVLYNLLDNAIKFSPDQSSITIETTEKGDTIFVSVKDRGVGIEKENLPKIWERFYKIDASRGKDKKGTGLGLSIVKEIINAHNQNINVISTKGVGTEFIFTLSKAE